MTALCLVYLSFPVLAQAPNKVTPELSNLVLIQENSLVSMISPVMEERPPETKLSDKYSDIIDQLCLCESGNNPDIINPNDKGSPSYGILQFKEPTYRKFCVEKYGIDEDIMNPKNQKECASEMLEEDFDNIFNWANCWNKIVNK